MKYNFKVLAPYIIGLCAFAGIAAGVVHASPNFLKEYLLAAVDTSTESTITSQNGALSLQLNKATGRIQSIKIGTATLPLVSQGNSVRITELNGRALSPRYLINSGASTFQVASPTGGIPVVVSEKYTEGSTYIRLDATVQSAQELPFQVVYTLPINANGWKWHDTLRSTRTIQPGATYEYLNVPEAQSGAIRTSVYPIGTISNDTYAMTLAIPLDQPRIYKISYTNQGLSIAFDVGTSADAKKLNGLANVSLVMYSSRGDEGMRGALAKYYSIFPQFFTNRIPASQHGTWNRVGSYSLKYQGSGPGVSVSGGTPEASWATDYGYGSKNVSAGDIATNRWSNAANTLTAVYRQDWVYNANNTNSYNVAVAHMQTDAKTNPRAQAALTSSAKRSDGLFAHELYFSGDTIQFHQNTEVPVWRNLMNSVTDTAIQTNAARAPGDQFKGLHMDSWSGIQRWNASYDYDRSHWAYASLPLIPNYAGGVAQLLAFPNYYYLANDFAARAHAAGLYVSANTNNPERRALGWLGADVIDFFGIESSLNTKGAFAGSTVDSYSIWKRAIAYQRPVSTLQPDLRTASDATIRSILNQNVFYNIYVSGDPGEGLGNTPNAVPAMHKESARAIFKQYTPIFKTLSAAGWEPVTYAVSSNPSVWVERYGSLIDGNLHLTVRNETGAPQTTTLALGIQPGIQANTAYTFRDLLGIQTTLSGPASNGNRVTFTIPAQTTLVFKVTPQAAPPALPVPVPSNPAGTYDDSVAIALTAAGSNSIRYTLNGTVPTCSTGLLYSNSIEITSSSTLKTIACPPAGSITASPSAIGSYVYNIRLDIRAPRVRIMEPSRNSTVSGIVTIVASSSDNRAVAGVQFQIDSVDIGSEDTTFPYVLNWNSTSVADGPHVITATSRDPSNNERTSTSTIINVRNALTGAPRVRITQPLPNATVSGTVNLVATPVDGRAVAGVQFEVDDADVGVEILTPPYVRSWDTTRVADGTHVITAIARSPVGTERTATTTTVTVRNGVVVQRPTCSLTGPATATSGSLATLSWTATNSPTRGTLTLQGSSFATTATLPAGSTRVTVPSVTSGTVAHTYTLTVSNTAGTATCQTRINVTAPPATALPSPTATPAGGTYNAPVSVTLQSAGSGSIRYTLGTTNPTCTTGTVYSSPITIASSATLRAIACPSTSAASTNSFVAKLFQSVRSLAASVLAAVTGATLPSPVATFVYTINLPPATNNYLPRGSIGQPNQSGQNCSISGWTCDLDNLSKNATVVFYNGSTRLGEMRTNFARLDAAAVASACGSSMNANGTFTNGYVNNKGFRVVFKNLPTGSYWITAQVKDMDSNGTDTARTTWLPYTASYSVPVVCDASKMTGTLQDATVIDVLAK